MFPAYYTLPDFKEQEHRVCRSFENTLGLEKKMQISSLCSAKAREKEAFTHSIGYVKFLLELMSLVLAVKSEVFSGNRLTAF